MLVSLVVLGALSAARAEGEEPVKGVNPVLARYYEKGDADGFLCLDGSATVAWESINNGACECADCSDEPGTRVLPSQPFLCAQALSALPVPEPAEAAGCRCCDCEDRPGEEVQDAKEKCGEARMATILRWQEGAEARKAALDAFLEGKYGRMPGMDEIADPWEPLTALEPVSFGGFTLDIGRRTAVGAAGEALPVAFKTYVTGDDDDPAGVLSFGGVALSRSPESAQEMTPFLLSADFAGAHVRFECGPESLRVAWEGTARGDAVAILETMYACDERAVGVAVLNEIVKNGIQFHNEDEPKDPPADL